MTDWDKAYTASHEAGNFYPPTYEPTRLEHLGAFADAWLDSVCAVALLAILAGYLFQRFFN